MDEKLYKIKKGSEFEFYSTEASGTINKIVGETTQETETASLITVDEYSQVELDRDDKMRKVSIESTLDDITQQTREGYNLLDYSSIGTKTVGGITISYSEDGYLTANGTQKTNWTNFFYKDITNILEDGKTYTLWTENKNKNLYDTSYTLQVSITGIGDVSNINYFISLGNKTFTVDKSKYSKYIISIQMADKMLTLNDDKNRFMLYEGIEEKPYEEYGASPSLDYPSEFENVVTAQNIQVLKKNILNTNSINKTVGGVAINSKSDGGIHFSGTPTSTWSSINVVDFTVPISKDTYISVNYGKTTSLLQDNTDIRPFFWTVKTDGTSGQSFYGSFVVKLTADISRITFGIEHMMIGKAYDEDIYIELEISNTKPTKFNQYDGNSKSIALPENKFLGNFQGYKNYIKDNKLKSNLKIVEFNGTENFYIANGEEYKGFVLQKNTTILASNVASRIMLSNYFKCVNSGESWKGKNTFGFSYNDVLWFQTDDDFETIDDWKSFLAQQKQAGTPLQILYISSEEEETSLEEINLPLYNGTNNIFCENSNISFYPYADMPSLERPSPIESISGEYNINIHGENFLQDQYNTTDLSQYNWCFYIKANLKPDTTYTISLIGAIDNRYYLSEELAVGGSSSFAFTMTGERQSITFTTRSDISGAWINSRQMYNFFKNAKAQPHEHIFKDVMLVEGSVAKDYVPYVSSTTTIELPEGVELNKINREDYVKQDGTITINSKRIVFTGTENFSKLADGDNYNEYSLLLEGSYGYDVKSNYFNNISPNRVLISGTNSNTLYVRVDKEYNLSTLELFKSFLADKYEEDTPVEIVVNLNEPTKSVLPTTEVTKMQLFPVIIGENHLVAPSEMVLLYYDEREEEEDIQPITITNEGKLLPFNLLVDYNKTDLPLIAEAIEASQTITGADGDLVLDTTYGSRLFEIDAVTDDFLTPEQKEAKREEIREFLNSIKKVNTKLIIEPQNRTYEVKYAGLAEDTNLPKCVEFLIPLKSASAYAISNTTYTLEGEGEIESETKAPAGFVCTISGPSNYPELALNGYLMAYENVILEGEKLIIDTKKSTVTKISTTGVKTNAMVYYNHQFPRIQEGLNLFTIISGIDEDKLKIEWNDLLL